MSHYKIADNSRASGFVLYYLEDGVDPASIEAFPKNAIQITDDEANAIREADRAAYLSSIPYTEKRAAEYPPYTDYLDGIVKGDQEQIAKYIADCLAVKAKYPKV